MSDRKRAAKSAFLNQMSMNSFATEDVDQKHEGNTRFKDANFELHPTLETPKSNEQRANEEFNKQNLPTIHNARINQQQFEDFRRDQ